MKNVLNVKVVFGSWNAYNECNERALGSKWLDMRDFDTVDDIYKELKLEGFTDEELEETFIQDYESEIEIFEDCDYINIDACFKFLKKIDSLTQYEVSILKALVKVEGINYVQDLLNDEQELHKVLDNATFYEGATLRDLAFEFVDEMFINDNLSDSLKRYFNYDQFIQDLEYDGYYETADGVLEIYYY